MPLIERLNGPENMRLDAALLELAESGQVAWRVYGWDGPWVTLGRFQTPVRALVSGCKVPYAMRPTGGRAVMHGHDVTVGLAVPLAILGVDSSRRLRAVYESVCGVLVEALRNCEVEATLGTRDPHPPTLDRRPSTLNPRPATRSEDCFMATSPNDIVDLATGFKICGCALRLTDRAVLVQASIPAGPPLVDPAEVYAHPAPVHWISLHEEAFAEALNRAINQRLVIPQHEFR